MLNEILGFLFIICQIWFFAYVILYNIGRLAYFIKCLSAQKCCNRKCHFNQYCDKYTEILTEEEFKILENLIEEKRKELINQ